jgi:hypothetical protein
VTATLTNQRQTAAESVSVATQIYAGNTTDDDPVWVGTEPVGRLGAGESYTGTQRVQLSFSDAFAVREADGWTTVVTTVGSDGETIEFLDRRQVA